FPTIFGVYAHVGTVYHIAVSGVDRGTGPLGGDIVLGLDETIVPANDLFAHRIPISGTNLSLAVTNLVATREPAEPRHGADGSHSVWWSWTAPASGWTTVWNFSWTVDTLAAVYQGNSLEELTPIGARAYLWDLF